MNRGEVYWCDMPEPDRRWPAVILTRQSSLSYLSGVTVAPITSRMRTAASFVALSTDDGLYADCCVNCDAVQTVPLASIGTRISLLSEAKLRAIDDAIKFALQLS